MMLTDVEINNLCREGEENNWTDSQFVRAVIAANNAKVLADLKPDVSHFRVVGSTVWHKLEDSPCDSPDVEYRHYYSADQVAALIQERDAQKQRIDELEAKLENGVLVNRGALNLVLNALRRDAEEGRQVRAEMADELLKATS